MTVRLIPRLDIKGLNLVKGIHLEGLRVLGEPENFAELYSELGADELLYMDIVASLYERNSILDVVKKTSSKIFIPLTVGGGLRSISDIRNALHSGADKVALNTAVTRRPELIKEATEEFGTSTIVVSIEAKKQPSGNYEAYYDCGRERTHKDAIEWAKEAAELGAGELMVTSIDQEGTGKGYDIELTKRISEAVFIPVVACGGAGKLSHLSDVIQQCDVDAVSLAAMLHYGLVKQYPDLGLNASKTISSGYSRIECTSILEIKEHLRKLNIDCRPVEIG
jgi:imidazole glycerol-phosphate synthase subunit HisF